MIDVNPVCVIIFGACWLLLTSAIKHAWNVYQDSLRLPATSKGDKHGNG